MAKDGNNRKGGSIKVTIHKWQLAIVMVGITVFAMGIHELAFVMYDTPTLLSSIVYMGMGLIVVAIFCIVNLLKKKRVNI